MELRSGLRITARAMSNGLISRVKGRPATNPMISMYYVCCCRCQFEELHGQTLWALIWAPFFLQAALGANPSEAPVHTLCGLVCKTHGQNTQTHTQHLQVNTHTHTQTLQLPHIFSQFVKLDSVALLRTHMTWFSTLVPLGKPQRYRMSCLAIFSYQRVAKSFWPTSQESCIWMASL